MATVSALIADVQVRMGDPSGNIFTSASLLGWLNEAQKDFIIRAMPLRRVDATSIATGLNRFPVPSDRLMIEGLFTRNSIGLKMKRLSFTEFNDQQNACPGAVGHDSDSWSEMDEVIYTHPAYGVKAQTTLLSANISSTDTTIPVVSTSGFKQWGRIRIDSDVAGNPGEEIEYYSKDATNFYGATRGLGGTAPAGHAMSHGNGVTQLDLWIVYRRAPTALVNMTDVPDIRGAYHEKLELYVMYLCYKQEGSEDKAAFAWKLWEQAVKDAFFSAAREHLGQVSVHDMDAQDALSLYGVR